MRTNFETQTIGLATELDESLFNTMNNNDKYMKDRLDVSGGKLVLFKELDTSETIPSSDSTSGSDDRLVIYESEYDYVIGRSYRIVFQSRSITCEAGTGYPFIYYQMQLLDTDPPVGEFVDTDGNYYTAGLSYGPLNLDYILYINPDSFVGYEVGDVYTYKVYLALRIIDLLSLGTFPIEVDSSEGAKAYFALYDMGSTFDV